MIELAIATSILMIGLVSLLSASSRMNSLRQSNREQTMAHNALRSLAERMHSISHGFSRDPDTWAHEVRATFAAGGSIGNTFPVEGLDAPHEGESVGTIVIGTDETAGDADLGFELGMPRDLNGDGDASDTDVAESARLLPVVLTLRWRGGSGLQQVRHGFYLMGY